MPKPAELSWDPSSTPDILHPMLRALGEHYPITESPAARAIAVTFSPGAPAGQVSVDSRGRSAAIRYDQPNHALRGIGSLLASLVKPNRPFVEQTAFTTFGIMLDCSRNAVMTVEHLQGWLRQLALLGYNMVMLYTEDTYTLPGEPAFGYQRGSYTPDEVRQIDDYAAGLGIEIVPCIQTLGHLAQILKWQAYLGVRDTSSVLLADEPATYALIEKMVANFAACCRSRRIHVGMDEAHDLGRGVFMDRSGYQRNFDIFNRHLAKVVEICARHGLSPMIWSDMYFRMGSKRMDYYDPNVQIPPDVKAAIPPQVQLVYWDYYHDDAAFYADYIDRHRALGSEPIMASGVWTWLSLWHDEQRTKSAAIPCILACRQKQLRELIFTMWGDDGAYCEFDSAFAGLAMGAEVAFNGEQYPPAQLAKRFAAVCGADLKAVQLMSGITHHRSAAVLADDPILLMWYKSHKAGKPRHWPTILREYQRLLAKVGPYAKTTEPIDLAHGVTVLKCLIAKLDLAIRLDKAYAKRDRAGLSAVRRSIPAMIRRIDELLASLRRQWYRRNKPEGFEVVQIRLGGLKQRYIELAQRLADLAAGRITSIPELEAQPIELRPSSKWHQLATASSIL